MKRKALLAYAVLLVILFVLQVSRHGFSTYLLPFYLVAAPLLLGGRINVMFSARDLAAGLLASVVILVPFHLLFPARPLLPLRSPAFLLYQFFAVSFAEEVFFRGFLQQVLGNTLKGVFVVSVLFSVAHLPALLFMGDIYAPLTFFPSLVMGVLYVKTSNVLPSTLFHFFANVLFTGFMI